MVTIDLSSCPCNEDCAQVGQEGYEEQGRKESQVYRDQLLRTFPDKLIPEHVVLMANLHDFGTYFSVAVQAHSEAEVDNAIYVENNMPEMWDEESLRVLGYVDCPMCLSRHKPPICATWDKS